MIRSACESDAAQLSQIYNHYIKTSIATFEEVEVTSEEMFSRVSTVINSDLPWLVAESDNDSISGFAYASVWKARSAYRFTVEVTVYLSPKSTQQGIGTQLYKALFLELKKRSIINVLACISLPNPESIYLHEKFDMQQVASFNKVGLKFGKWIDVGYWQGVLK